MIYFILFIFGLSIGSFLNVVSLRFVEKYSDQCGSDQFASNFLNSEAGQLRTKSWRLHIRNLKSIIGGRSRCPHCLKTLCWYELFPIFSFAWQKGRCRSCLKKISWQYPIVELLSGLIFVFIPSALMANGQWLVANQWPAAIIWLIIFELFLLLSIIDLRLYIIPDSINLSLAILGAILIFLKHRSFLGPYAHIFDLPFLNNQLLLSHLFAAFIVMVFYGAIIFFTRSRGMGFGDFKLIGAIGLIFGWPDALIISLLAFVIGAILSIPLLIRGLKTMKDPMPFGPFIIAAAALIFFFGQQMAAAYFKLFGLLV